MALVAAFTAEGVGAVFQAQKAKKFSYAVTGTFVGTWRFVRLTPDRSAVLEVIASGTSTQAAVTVEPDESANYRFECTAFTSGTITGTITDLADTLEEYQNNAGETVFKVTDDGVEVKDFSINTAKANTEPVATFANAAGNFNVFRVDQDPNSVITGSKGDLCVDSTNGTMYIKNTGDDTDTGWVVEGGTPTFKSYALSNPGSAGTFYIGGHYEAPAAHVVLTIGGTVTQTLGAAQESHAAHAFVVASGAGGTDLVLTVTGTSITDAGVRTTSDSEIVVADTDAAITDQYFETSKKWLGQITYTLTGSSGAFTFNYGFSKYDDFGGRNFTITDFEATGEARANETGLNIELLHHASDKFVYSAAAFVPNATACISLATDHSTDNNVTSGESFAYKRAALSQAVLGGVDEGTIIRVTTVVNNSINDATFHIGANIN